MSTKKELVRQMAETGLTHQQSRQIIDDILDQIFDCLSTGEEVQITNFGRFELRKHSGRTMKNPNTGERHDVPDRYLVHFNPSSNFVDRFQDDSVDNEEE